MRAACVSPPRRPLLRSALAAVGVAAATLAVAAPAGAQTPPPAAVDPPAAVTVAPAGPTRATEVRVAWTRPASVPDDVATRWSLCPVADPQPDEDLDDPSCTSGIAEAPTGATVPTPTEGRSLLRVRFVADGMADGPAASPAEPVVVDRTAPGRPTVKYDGTTMRWAAPEGQNAPIVRAHWRLCRGWAVPAARPCLEGASESASFPLSEEQVPFGPPPGYCPGSGASIAVWLEDAAGNADPAASSILEYSVVPDCVAPPLPTAPPAAPVAAAATRMTVTARIRPLARGRHSVTLTATLAPKAAAGRVRLTAEGGAFARARTATVRGGRATTTIVVPRAVRRLSVRGAYAATATHTASAARATVRLPRR